MARIKLVPLLSVVFIVHTVSVVVPEQSDSLRTDVHLGGLIKKEAVSINAIGEVIREEQGASKLVRSERKDLDASDVYGLSSEEHERSLMLPEVLERSEAEEQRIIEEFTPFFDGQWINMQNMKSTQSSSRDGGVPERAVDLNKNGLWEQGSCTHTKKEPYPWWQVDLAAVHVISAVELTIRKDCCGWHCNQCPKMTVNVDWMACHANASFALGESNILSCPWVGDLIRVTLEHDENYLMLCEVRVKGAVQSMLLQGVSQCEKHSVLAQLVRTPTATDGLCTAGLPSQGDTFNALSSFQELIVGSELVPGGELRTTSEECEEHLLTSNDMVEGAVWQEMPELELGKGARPTGLCRLLAGRRISGAQHAVGARCFRKLRCPREMAPWKARANTKKGQTWANATGVAAKLNGASLSHGVKQLA